MPHNDKPNEYLSIAQVFEGDPLKVYYNRLNYGTPFIRNHNGEYIVVKMGFSKDRHALDAMTKSAYVWRGQQDGEYIPVLIAELSKKNHIKICLIHLRK
ncbi:hypothetical protein B0A79_23870 [Flavobacterium piscis]|uniref:Uncharacterized protein n=1 Tax=Flavobacterium piscis TaxID=1114874 RepID=A0ABX2XJT2_9FLAO|nr:hypothetical protein FLP_08790 [Flavobacterium piscis]OXE95930.1 hypothetical protein B0A79_23870 [Flavobacterium piscis]